jgi:uncharacterized membrane protein YgdD (TMEM256/DUF423 family)
VERIFYIGGAVAGFIAAAMGAIGVHALKSRVEPELFGMFETAVRYQMFHALALFAAAWGVGRWRHRAIGAAGVLFIIGMVLFSVTIYVRVLAHAEWATALAPAGGVAYLTGWLCLGVGAWRGNRAVG